MELTPISGFETTGTEAAGIDTEAASCVWMPAAMAACALWMPAAWAACALCKPASDPAGTELTIPEPTGLLAESMGNDETPNSTGTGQADAEGEDICDNWMPADWAACAL